MRAYLFTSVNSYKYPDKNILSFDFHFRLNDSTASHACQALIRGQASRLGLEA